MPNITSLGISGICFLKLHLLKFARLLDKLIASKFALFSVSGLKDEKLIKKLTIHEN